MSSAFERESRLTVDLVLGRISEDEFYREFPTKPEEVSAVGLAMLQRALQERDAVGVETGLNLGHRFGISPEYLDVLCSLAAEGWHQGHEGVVSGLARLRAPSSVDVLYRTATSTHAYLDYDEAYALGVKCIWALGSIQTREATVRLGELLRCGNEVLEINAEEQLDRIVRLTNSEAVRAAAHEALAKGRSTEANK